MAKTKDELNKIKEEVENISKKLQELTDEELEQVIGGCYGVCYEQENEGSDDDKPKSYPIVGWYR